VLDPRFDGNRLTVNTLVAPREVIQQIGGWDAELPPWEHDDLFLRLNAVCSLEAVDRALYEVTEHPGTRGSGNLLASATAIEATYRKHRMTFQATARGTGAHYVGAAGAYYLRAGRWWDAIRCTGTALAHDPTQARLWRWFAASLAGPRAVRFLRRASRTR
jgi:hypothetical protein